MPRIAAYTMSPWFSTAGDKTRRSFGRTRMRAGPARFPAVTITDASIQACHFAGPDIANYCRAMLISRPNRWGT
jgi:hypothetical protein